MMRKRTIEQRQMTATIALFVYVEEKASAKIWTIASPNKAPQAKANKNLINT